MDIYEKYSSDEIESVKEFIEYNLEEHGFTKTMELLKSSQNRKRFWKKYLEDRKMEEEEQKNSNNQKKSNDIENYVVELMTKIFLSPKTQKMEEAEEEQFNMETVETEKIWDICKYDSEMQSVLADELDSMEYDKNDPLSKMENLRALISAEEMITSEESYNVYEEDGKCNEWSLLKEAISNKIEQMDCIDFIIFYTSVGCRHIFGDEAYTNAVLKNVQKMTPSELAIFMITTQDGLDCNNEKIVNIKTNRVKEINLPYMNYIYNILNYYRVRENITEEVDKSYLPELLMTESVRLKCGIEYKDQEEKEKELGKLIKSDEYKDYLKNMSNLQPKELVRYLLLNGDGYSNMKSDYEAEYKLLDEKLQSLSDKDIVVLLEGSYFEIMYNENRENLIINEARRRGLLSTKYEKSYSEEMKEDAQKDLDIYEMLNDRRYPIAPWSRFQHVIKEDDDDLDDRSSTQILLSRYKKLVNENKKAKSLYDTLELISKSKDKEIVKLINKFNSELTKDTLSNRNSKYQEYLVNYLQRKMIGMSPNYSIYYDYNENGCLNDVIRIKIEEFQDILTKQTNIDIPGSEMQTNIISNPQSPVAPTDPEDPDL